MDEKVLTLKFSHRELLEQPPLSHVTAPFIVVHKWEPEARWRLRRLFWVTVFGKAKKVTGCRANPLRR